MSKTLRLFFLFILFVFCISSLYASSPQPWQLGFQESVTPVMERVNAFHNMMMVIITFIILFVFSLLLYILIRFKKKNNPVPSKKSHNLYLEIFWTIVPIIIVISIAIPSIKLLSFKEEVPEPDMTIKVLGYQWYWGYEYVDHNNLSFDSNIQYDLKPNELRLLTVDNRLVLPINTDIKVQVTAADVIHSWAVPAFGVKIDAVPGRLNETWVNINKPGVYYGQCSELCGILHGFMPIVVEAMKKEDFDNWLKSAKKQFL